MQNNFLFELLPLLAFFAVYYVTKNLFLATAICIIASWTHVLFCKIKYHKISKNIWLSTSLITIFGGLTIILHDKTFVMLKPTLLFWLIGGSLLIGQAMGKNGIELILAKELSLPKPVWAKLNSAWGLFFIGLGGLNLYVAFNCSEYVWVKFKVFGGLILTLAFVIICGIFIVVQQKKYKS
jgi:intracellular septation protein